MKLGLVSSILDGYSFEEMMDKISELGFTCVEAACWPVGKAERRYAGVTHIDAKRVLEEDAYSDYVKNYALHKNIEISSLACYQNPMDSDIEKRAEAGNQIKTLIKASKKLGIGMITTFLGRDQNRTVEENLRLVQEVWPPMVELAEQEGVRIAIENCPMLFGEEQWPGGQNLMTTPAIWKKVFEILPSKNLGINYDPSHFIWQMMDPVAPIYEFGDRILHAHGKDIKVYRERLNQVGIMAYPLEYMSPKLPGLGDVDWGQYVSALTDIGYDGYFCIEVEDKAFEGSREKVEQSLVLSKRYLESYII